MRVFAISDIHIDYNENKKWLFDLSRSDYIEDILILAGDITSKMSSIIKAFVALKKRFKEVLFIPGNHDLWINRKNNTRNSLDNFFLIKTIAGNCGIRMEPAHFGPLSIIPLYGWYDYSFGKPSEKIYEIWIDYSACEWPEGYNEVSITRYFTAMNESFLNIKNNFIISFSHFLPRIDVMPLFIPQDKRKRHPVRRATHHRVGASRRFRRLPRPLEDQQRVLWLLALLVALLLKNAITSNATNIPHILDTIQTLRAWNEKSLIAGPFPAAAWRNLRTVKRWCSRLKPKIQWRYGKKIASSHFL